MTTVSDKSNKNKPYEFRINEKKSSRAAFCRSPVEVNDAAGHCESSGPLF